jgi:hypothetical protein
MGFGQQTGIGYRVSGTRDAEGMFEPEPVERDAMV